MTSLQERVLQLIKREILIPEDGRVLVALSGGADSVALTLLLQELAPTAGFAVVGLAHLNHQLRQAAVDDERFCRELARRLALPIEVGRADVRERARGEGISIEEAGHRERYAFFERVAGQLGAHRVATAHTRSDQAETYLMRLIRGAGPVGLAGIRPRAGHVVRPLLELSRTELRTYLAQRGQSFREDETNKDVRVTRNRIRHELLPFLEERFSPAIVDVLAREADIARSDAEWLDGAANQIAATFVSSEGVVTVDVETLASQPKALARRVAKRALEQVAQRAVGFDQIERFLELAAQPGPALAEADFPGCRVERRDERILVCAPRRRVRHSAEAEFTYQLAIPGEVKVPEAGLAILAQRVSGSQDPEARLTARGGAVMVAGEQLTAPLIVRNWRPGDAVRPLGLGGRKKLQDFFVDRKVTRSERHLVPIVADKKRGIVWVVGHTVAEDFRVTASTKGMLVLKAKKLGGAV